MARVSRVALFAVVAVLVACAAGAEEGSDATFHSEKPIRQVVTDGLCNLETSRLQTSRKNTQAIRMTYFAIRWVI